MIDQLHRGFALSVPLALILAGCQTSAPIEYAAGRAAFSLPSVAAALELPAPLDGTGHVTVTLSQTPDFDRKILAVFSDIERLEIRLVGTGPGASTGHTASRIFNRAALGTPNLYHTFTNLPTGGYDLIVEAFDASSQSIGKVTERATSILGIASTAKARIKLSPTVVANPNPTLPAAGHGPIAPTGAVNTDVRVEDGVTVFATTIQQTIDLIDSPLFLVADSIGNIWATSNDHVAATNQFNSYLIKVASDGTVTGRFNINDNVRDRPVLDRGSNIWPSSLGSRYKFSSSGILQGKLSAAATAAGLTFDLYGNAQFVTFEPDGTIRVTPTLDPLIAVPPIGTPVNVKAVDGQGNLWIVQSGQLKHVTASGAPIGVAALPAGAGNIMAVKSDATGNAWVYLTKHEMVHPGESYYYCRVVKLSPTGALLHDVDMGAGETAGFVLDPAGNVWLIQQKATGRLLQLTSCLVQIGADGTLKGRYQVPDGSEIQDLAFDAGGRLWAADRVNKKLYRIAY